MNHEEPIILVPVNPAIIDHLGVGVIHLKVGDDDGDGKGHSENPAQGTQGAHKHAEIGLE